MARRRALQKLRREIDSITVPPNSPGTLWRRKLRRR